MRNTYIIIVGKPEGKRPVGRLRKRWYNNNNNVKMNGLDLCGPE
jgi:hypothetical protein